MKTKIMSVLFDLCVRFDITCATVLGFFLGSRFLICLCYHADTLGLGHMGLSIYPTYSMSAAFELPINIFTIFCLDSVGRRWPNVCFMATAGILAFTFAAVGDSGTKCFYLINMFSLFVDSSVGSIKHIMFP